MNRKKSRETIKPIAYINKIIFIQAIKSPQFYKNSEWKKEV